MEIFALWTNKVEAVAIVLLLVILVLLLVIKRIVDKLELCQVKKHILAIKLKVSGKEERSD